MDGLDDSRETAERLELPRLDREGVAGRRRDVARRAREPEVAGVVLVSPAKRTGGDPLPETEREPRALDLLPRQDEWRRDGHVGPERVGGETRERMRLGLEARRDEERDALER